MRVAFVAFDFGEYCVRLSSAIGASAQVGLFSPDDEVKPYLHLLHNDVTLRPFTKPRLRQAPQQLLMLQSLVRQINEFKPDVIHLQAGHLWFNWALPLLGRPPLVVTVHDAVKHVGDGVPWKTPQWALDRACDRASQRIVHAPQVKDLLLQKRDIQASTVHVIPLILHGDDTGLEHVPEEDGLILFFGRLWDYKGLEYLIQAEPLITAAIPQARIAIAGTGREFSHYRRLMVHPERFIVHNEQVSDEKRAELFRRASVVVLPYIEASQSAVIPIAYRFGKPVVATTVGGLPAIVDHGRTGYLVPPRDAGALADAIIRLLQDRGLRRQFGENGRQKVNSECGPDVVARQTLSVYEEALRTGSVTGKSHSRANSREH